MLEQLFMAKSATALIPEPTYNHVTLVPDAGRVQTILNRQPKADTWYGDTRCANSSLSILMVINGQSSTDARMGMVDVYERNASQYHGFVRTVGIYKNNGARVTGFVNPKITEGGENLIGNVAGDAGVMVFKKDAQNNYQHFQTIEYGDSKNTNALYLSKNGRELIVAYDYGRLYFYKRPSIDHLFVLSYVIEPHQAGIISQRAAVSNDGLTLVIGAPSGDSDPDFTAAGSVSVYTRSSLSNRFELYQYIKEKPLITYSQLGRTVAVSNNGQFIAVGSSRFQTSTVGSVFIYEKTSSGYVLRSNFKATDAARSVDYFSDSLSFSKDSAKLMVTNAGAPGSILIYGKNNGMFNSLIQTVKKPNISNLQFFGRNTFTNENLTQFITNIPNYVTDWQGAIFIVG